MSKIIKKQITCPNCKKTVTVKLWTSMNLKTSPELREKVIDESLFSFFCPNCKYKSQLIYPFIYHDMKYNFMLYLIPDTNQDHIDFPSIQTEFPSLTNTKKRIVEDLNHLKEKILIFENNLDDKAIEVTKCALSSVLSKKLNKKITDSYFCLLDSETNHLGFSFLLKDNVDLYYQATKIQAYYNSIDVVKRSCENNKSQSAFIKIDSQWANLVLKNNTK